MKRHQAISITALAGLLMTSLPAPLVVAQATASSVRLAASRGQVEFLNGGGRWERLRGPVMAAEGTAIRTAPGSEMVATFADGSSMTLGEDSAMRFTRLRANGAGGEVGVRMLGQITANMSPSAMANTVTTFDTPVARATLNRAFATARAVRDEVAGSLAVVRLQTPTARAVRMAVAEGVATLQPVYNVEGLVTAIDPAHATFIMVDNRTGRARRVAVGANTLLAAHDPGAAQAHRSPQDVVGLLGVNTPVIVYGQPVTSEGPADMGDGSAVNAEVIFPGTADRLSPELFVTENGTNLLPAVQTVGAGLAVLAGHTGWLVAGDLLVNVVPGLALEPMAGHMVAPGVGGAAAMTSGSIVIGGIVVATIIGVAVINGNHGNSSNTFPVVFVPTPTTATVNVNVTRVNHSLARRSVARVAATDPAQTATLAASPVGSVGLGGAAFRGSATGASFVATPDGAVVARFPLNRRLQLHLAAMQPASDTFTTGLQMEFGLDYSLNPTHSIGVAVQNLNYNVVDAFGNASSLSNTMPELRYSVKY
ncbi:MAG TPA: hypothetical protein VGO93_29045 [Candidatus Xenobia bacterium]|jgi:hypothetical protein